MAVQLGRRNGEVADAPATASRPRRSPVGILLTVTALCVAVSMLLPLIWMVATSFKPEPDIVTFPPQLWPREFTLEHYVDVWDRIPFARLYVNTIIFAGGVTLVSLLFDSMMAYALARLRFRGRNVVFFAVLVMLMMPFQVTLVPLYDFLVGLGWTDTLHGLIVPRATNAFGIFFLRQFLLSLPRDLDEAARIDGASELRIFGQVIMPLAKPALLTLGLFHFQYNWNDLLWPLIINQGADARTLPAGLALFMGQHVVEYGLLMAASVLSLLPVVVFFLVIQRRFVEGVATTGLK